MEPVRDFIVKRYEVRSSSESPAPIQTWNRYPCKIITKCEKKGQNQCVGFVSIYVNTNTVK